MIEAPTGILRPLAILMALGAALALAGSSAGAPEARQPTSLQPNVAVRAHLAPGAVISLERGCPPPAVLACRPGMRVTARASQPLAKWLEPAVAAALEQGLRALGYSNLTSRSTPGGHGFGGRITSQGEVLGRWRHSDGIVEIAGGGLELRSPEARHAELASGYGVALNTPVLAALLRDHTG